MSGSVDMNFHDVGRLTVESYHNRQGFWTTLSIYDIGGAFLGEVTFFSPKPITLINETP